METIDCILTLNINGQDITRVHKFEKYDDSNEYIKTKLSEVAYELAQALLEDVKNF